MPNILHIEIDHKKLTSGTQASVITLDGALEKRSVDTLEQQVAGCMRQHSSHIIFNLRGVTFLDTAGLDFLANIAETIEQGGRKAVLTNVQAKIYTMLCSMGLNLLFTVYRDETSALASLQVTPATAITQVIPQVNEIHPPTDTQSKTARCIPLTSEDSEFIEKLRHTIAGRRFALPLLPVSAIHLMELTNNPQATLEELQHHIGQDLTIASTLLQVANSAMFRGIMPITSIKDAIMRLGKNRLRSMIVGLTLGSKIIKGKKIDILARDLWRHSMSCAGITSAVAKFRKHDDSTAFSAALIHDIHKAILLSVCRDMLGPDPAYFPSLPLLEGIYKEHAEIIHEEIHKKWSIPCTLIAIIKNMYNFNLSSADTMQDTALVALAHKIVEFLHDSTVQLQAEPEMRFLNMASDDIAQLIDQGKKICQETT